MRYLVKIAYDGSHFYGFQRQPKLRTVQGDIEAALKRIYGYHIDVHSTSRTDTGVHALMQAFHYDTEIKIPISRLSFALNSHLPEEISVLSYKIIPNDYHARYMAIKKTYQYDIILSKEKRVFESRYALIYKKELDTDLLNSATDIFTGKQNYAALMASGSDKENTVRTVHELYISKERDDLVSIYISADGFLYHMVRIIVGALLDLNEGKRSLEDLAIGIKEKNRNVFRRTAPASGLYLQNIEFESLDK